jgi:hypothetical protein
MPFKWGITLSAKSFVEFRVFSSGILPMWNRPKTIPRRRLLIMCSQRSRTVSGLPAITMPPSTRFFQVTFAKSFCASGRNWLSLPAWIVLIVREPGGSEKPG